MRSTRTRLALLVTAFSIAAFVLQTGTADAAKKSDKPSTSKRDAMIEQCIAKAQAEAPIVVPGQSGMRRTEIYKNCMDQAGMRP
jgi:hypothetical protein